MSAGMSYIIRRRSTVMLHKNSCGRSFTDHCSDQSLSRMPLFPRRIEDRPPYGSRASVPPTPVRLAIASRREHGADVIVKAREITHRPDRFKARGLLFTWIALHRAPGKSGRGRHATRGNHGQSVAIAGGAFITFLAIIVFPKPIQP